MRIELEDTLIYRRTIESGIPKIIDCKMDRIFGMPLIFNIFLFFLVKPTIMSIEKTTSLEYGQMGQIALF